MTLSNRAVIALTCLAVLAWGALDLLYERSLEVGRTATLSAAPTGAVDVETIARRRGFTVVDLPTTMSVLARALRAEDREAVQAKALLAAVPHGEEKPTDDDLRAAIYWIHSVLASQTWSQLKRDVYPRLSPATSNLRDEVLTRGGKTVEVFAFTDPTLSEERLLFARRGSFLLEAHIATGAEEEVETFVEELLQS